MPTCKRLLLVAFVLLCFINVSARAARTLLASGNEAPKGYADLSTPNEDVVVDSDELVAAVTANTDGQLILKLMSGRLDHHLIVLSWPAYTLISCDD
ncbi:hypothetical protein CJ030_MR6G025430 [Morella rubra]|uniref:Uncharacterized protein n=1 Tax=Morella rubra TaxID=262757 RepID=A0A6A1VCL4_9ROSI|nr:hypothetical protein CJ030_MR6G025430 [Morella rubra]